MSCANVQSVANICAPHWFTNAGTHRALPRSIDITPLTQATVPSMKHNHFISRTAAFSTAQPRGKSNTRHCRCPCVYKEILPINTLFILYSISRVRNSRVLKASNSYITWAILPNFNKLFPIDFSNCFINISKKHIFVILQEIKIYRELFRFFSFKIFNS